MGHPPSPLLCLKHLPGMVLHLPLSSLLWECLDQQLPRGQQRRGQIQAPGQEGRGWQDQSSDKGGNIGMEETACTLWEKAWGAWARAPILLHPPIKGLEQFFSFCQRQKGKEKKEHLPHHSYRHTLTHPLSSKGSTARWTTPHSRTNNHSPAPPQPSLPPPRGSDTQEQWVALLPTTDTLQPPGKREWAGGKEEEGWQLGQKDSQGEKERTKDSHSHQTSCR